MSLRGITRTFGACCQTIMALGGVGEKAAARPASEEMPLPSEKGDALELQDELLELRRQEDPGIVGYGRRFLPTHPPQIVACTVGDRSRGDGALCLSGDPPPPDYGRRAIRGDFWLACEGVFPQRTQRFCGKEEGEANHALNASLARCTRA